MATTLELWCATFGECTVTAVEIKRDATVHALQKAIHERMHFDNRYIVAPAHLTLYVARLNGAWLEENRDLHVLLRENDCAVTDKHKFIFMRASCPLSDYFDEDFEAKPGKIHVLVQLPASTAKRQRVETRLKDLWRLVDWPHALLPSPHELSTLLLRPLPFRLSEPLETTTPVDATLIFQPDAPRVDCPDLMSLMEEFLELLPQQQQQAFTSPLSADESSRPSWQPSYDALLRIPTALCSARGLFLQCNRPNATMRQLVTPIKPPDCVVAYDGVVVLRGEERDRDDARVATAKMLDQLMTTMRRWSGLVYSDLPYVVAYATSGPQLHLAAIERSGPQSLRWTSILSLDIVAEKEAALRVFFHVAMLLYDMATPQVQRVHRGMLTPFQPQWGERRVLVLMDNVVVRIVTRAHCDDHDHYKRLLSVYMTLGALGRISTTPVPYLQTVERVKDDGGQLTVHLSPVGYARRPQRVDGVEQWLRHVLTALMRWHEYGYCHGDVQWRNIVFVSGRSSSYRSIGSGAESAEAGAETTTPIVVAAAETGASAEAAETAATAASAESGADNAESCADGHWMLIDMDESREPNTQTITWNHERSGERLSFQHDLLQVGKLLETLRVELPPTLQKVQAFLLEAVDTSRKPPPTAAEALQLLNGLEAPSA